MPGREANQDRAEDSMLPLIPLDAIESQDGAVGRDLEQGKSLSLAWIHADWMQSASRQVGQYRAHREITLSRNRLGRLKNLVVNVQRRSRAGRNTKNDAVMSRRPLLFYAIIPSGVGSISPIRPVTDWWESDEDR